MTPQGLSGIAENFGIIAGVGVEGELTGGGIAKKGLYGEGCAHNVTFLSRDSGEDLLIWSKSWLILMILYQIPAIFAREK